ncbi:4675_t:CDS:2, partial [Entrophospora sp. SA101]
TPKGLSRRVFIWVCLVFCPRDGEHTKMLKCGLDGNNESLNIPCP